MVCSLHSVTTGSRDRANVSLIVIIIIIIDPPDYSTLGGLSLSDESFPNGGARGAFAKPPWVLWLKASAPATSS